MATIAGTAGADTITPTQNSAGGLFATAGADSIFGDAGADSLDGGGGTDTIDGGDDADRIDGAADDDVLFGGLGGDTLLGGDGADSLDGGEDDDSLLGGAGADTLAGSAGSDTLSGGAGGNLLDGGAGHDSLAGGDEAETLLGGDGFDLLFAGGGDDSLDGGEGDDTISGDEGADTIRGGGGNDAIGADRGTDLLFGEAGADTLYSGGTADTIHGGEGNDLIWLDQRRIDNPDYVVPYANHLFGDEGDDVFVFDLPGGGTRDIAGLVIDGGDGFDWIDFDAGELFQLGTALPFTAVEGMRLDGNVQLFGSTTGDSYDFRPFQQVVLGGGGGGITSLTVLAGAGADTIHSTEAPPIVFGASLFPSFFLIGEAGDDVLIGSAGREWLEGGAGSDSLAGGGGDDLLYGQGTVPQSLVGVDGDDTLDGGAGADTMQGGNGNDLYVVDNAGDAISEAGSTGADTVIASVDWALGSLFEWLHLAGSAQSGTGNVLDNRLTGNELANTLDGAGGADTLVGGAGNDVYVVRGAADVVIELAGGGIDLIQSYVDYALGSQQENLTLLGNVAVTGTGNGLANVITGNNLSNTLAGANGDDTLIGVNGNDLLNGGAGADSMAGGLGADRYVVDNLGDTILELAGEGNDSVIAALDWTLGENLEGLVINGTGDVVGTGNELNNRMAGNGGDNLLIGLAGRDVLIGGDGADTLVGGAGGDVLTGGADADLFVFEAPGDGVDRITDFTPGVDRIVALQAGFGLPFGTPDAANFVAHASNVATSPFGTAQFVYNTAFGVLSFDADGLGGTAAVRLAVLTGAPAVTAADILIV